MRNQGIWSGVGRVNTLMCVMRRFIFDHIPAAGFLHRLRSERPQRGRGCRNSSVFRTLMRIFFITSNSFLNPPIAAWLSAACGSTRFFSF